jgi:hypothetical protein
MKTRLSTFRRAHFTFTLMSFYCAKFFLNSPISIAELALIRGPRLSPPAQRSGRTVRHKSQDK